MDFFKNNYGAVRYPLVSEHAAGLRRAQLGAIHAIAAYFTKMKPPTVLDPAIIVMPTGSGKTAVLMLSAFVLTAKRVLVVTPSRLVREQITNEFTSLRQLTDNNILPEVAGAHRVKLVDSKITGRQDWLDLQPYDVVVSTPNCISPAYEAISDPPADLFLIGSRPQAASGFLETFRFLDVRVCGAGSASCVTTAPLSWGAPTGGKPQRGELLKPGEHYSTAALNPHVRGLREVPSWGPARFDIAD